MLNIKRVKPKPKQYHIAYAKLKHPKTITETSSNEKMSITVPKPQFNSCARTLTNNDKYSKILQVAVNKGIIEPDETDIKKMELENMSDEEFNNYCKEIEEADAIDVVNVAKEDNPQYKISATIPVDYEITKPLEENSGDITEAEAMLAKIKMGGPVIGDFSSQIDKSDYSSSSNFNSSENRSLKDIQSDRILQHQVIPDLDYGTSLESTMEQLKQAQNEKEQRIKTAKSKMTDFKGLTTPIIQQPKTQTSNPMESLFSNLNWTTGRR